MKWTVSRRIAAGLGLLLGVVLVLGTVAVMALRRSTEAYSSALGQQQRMLEAALVAQSDGRQATVEYLRFLLVPDERFAVRRDSLTSESRDRLASLQDSADSEARAQWSRAMDALREWDRVSRGSLALARAGRRDEAVRLYGDSVLPARLAVEGTVTRAVDITKERTARKTQASVAAARRIEMVLLFTVLIALALGITLAVMLTRAVTRPLRESSTVLASSAAEILAASTQQAASASETSAAIVETSTTVDEVAQTSEQAAERARAVADSAQRAAEVGLAGRQAVEASVKSMAVVNTHVESIASSIVALAEQAQSISEIIEAVDDIADQTNLLALNAAVEAARAGEHGRGFAVVAGEVRSLADQSKKATVRVRQMLTEIQRATSAAVMTTERGSQQVTAARTQVDEAGDTIRALADAVTEAAQAAAQIVASAGQHAVGMAQIRQAMGSIQEATHQNLAATRQSEQAAQDLNALGVRLLELVGTDQPLPHRALRA